MDEDENGWITSSAWIGGALLAVRVEFAGVDGMPTRALSVGGECHALLSDLCEHIRKETVTVTPSRDVVHPVVKRSKRRGMNERNTNESGRDGRWLREEMDPGGSN